MNADNPIILTIHRKPHLAFLLVEIEENQDAADEVERLRKAAWKAERAASTPAAIARTSHRAAAIATAYHACTARRDKWVEDARDRGGLLMVGQAGALAVAEKMEAARKAEHERKQAARFERFHAWQADGRPEGTYAEFLQLDLAAGWEL